MVTVLPSEPPQSPSALPRYDPVALKLQSISADRPLFVDFDREQSRSLLVNVDQPGLYDLQTEGLLATSCRLRTPTISPIVDRLATLQRRMLDAATALVVPGGVLVYSVCTLTAAESIDHRLPPGWVPLPTPGPPWRHYGDGARLLPQDADTDGMVVLRYRRQP